MKDCCDNSIGLCKRYNEYYELDLQDLEVVTELASGPYFYLPFSALLAGAKVNLVGKDSPYGKFTDLRKSFEDTARKLKIDHFEIHHGSIPERVWSQADIVTNSYMLRPITPSQISLMKHSSVIPLMWETWEFRHTDFCIKSCIENSVTVVGTNENGPKLNMFPLNGMLAMKLLFELKCEIYENELVLLGSSKSGEYTARALEALGISFDWYTQTGDERENRCYPYSELRNILGKQYLDAIICNESCFYQELVGQESALSFFELKQAFPYLKWAHIYGTIDVKQLQESGIRHSPKKIRPAKFMSYQPSELGDKPVIKLNAVGLKVGELVTRARRSGLSIEDSIQVAVDYGLGQDFEGGYMNYQIR